MKVFKGFRIALQALLGHPIRTVLSLVGIIIGVGAVILLVAVGEGAQKEVLEKIQSMGTNLIIVSAGQVKTVGGRLKQISVVTTLSPKDANAIASEIACSAMLPLLKGSGYCLNMRLSPMPLRWWERLLIFGRLRIFPFLREGFLPKKKTVCWPALLS